MIDISTLEQYFPTVNEPISIETFTFRIVLQQTATTFTINLKIKQQSIPGEHLIKFRFGIGQDKPQTNASHYTDRPHFEIETYIRGEETIATTMYFTFNNPEDENLLNYAKGTVVFIEKIVRHFFHRRELDERLIEQVLYADAILDELKEYEHHLIAGLVECFRSGELILRDGTGTVIRTPYRLQKCLSAPELQPLLQPLLQEIGYEPKEEIIEQRPQNL